MPDESKSLTILLPDRDFAQVKLLIVGDLWLDRFLSGELDDFASAGVPVLRNARRQEQPGGAGILAVAAIDLGCQTFLCGLWGHDAEQAELARLLEAAKVDTTGVVTSALATASQTHFSAAGKDLLRLDVGGGALPLEDAVRLEARAVELVKKVHAVILVDEGKNTLSVDLCSAILRAAHAAAVPVVVKSSNRDLSLYSGAAVVLLGADDPVTLGGPAEDEAAVTAAARAQMEEHEIGHLILPLEGRGMRVLGLESDFIAHGSSGGEIMIAPLAAALAVKLEMNAAMELAMRIADALSVSRPLSL